MINPQKEEQQEIQAVRTQWIRQMVTNQKDTKDIRHETQQQQQQHQKDTKDIRLETQQQQQQHYGLNALLQRKTKNIKINGKSIVRAQKVSFSSV